MNILKLLLNFIQRGNNTDRIVKEIENIHPRQIVYRCNDSMIQVYRIDYEYTTIRNNKHTGYKIFVFNTKNPEIDIKSDFHNWIEDFNKANPYRNLLNVKILKSESIGWFTYNYQ